MRNGGYIGVQSNKMAAMLVHQASRVGFNIFSCVNTFFCPNKFA